MRAMQAAIRALTAYKDDVAMQLQGFSVLAALPMAASVNPLPGTMSDEGMHVLVQVTAVMTSMERHLTCAELQLKGLQTLVRCVCGLPYMYGTRLVQQTAVRALQAHAADAAMQEAAWRSVAALFEQ
jgi:hypothetical protein